MLILITVLALSLGVISMEVPKRPNIVILLANDLGYGDLSCYGNRSFSTPNIDRLAAGGVQLTHHLSASAITTASRGALMTGRYPVRYGLQAPHHGPALVINVFGAAGLPQNETTFARLLSDAGYRTKYVGKWQLGWSCKTWEDQCHGPLSHGFQEFLGFVCGPSGFRSPYAEDRVESDLFKKNVMSHLFCDRTDTQYFSKSSSVSVSPDKSANCSKEFAVEQWNLWRDRIVKPSRGIHVLSPDVLDFAEDLLVRDKSIEEWPVSLPGVSQKLDADSLQFLRSAAETPDQPFLLVHSFLHPHIPLFVSPEFEGVSGHSRYADAVIEMDWGVGQILDVLDATGAANNTIVHFASLHGAWLEPIGEDMQREGGSNYPFRGGKMQGAMEGGVSVPGIFRWPQVIPSGRRVDVPTSTMDLLPTLLDAAGVSYDHLTLDGKSILDLLQGDTEVSPHRMLFHYCGNDVHAVRYSPPEESAVYKLYLKMPNYTDPSAYTCNVILCFCYGRDVIELAVPKLYDVEHDPSEEAEIPEHDERYQKHAVRMLLALVRHQSEGIGVSSQFEVLDQYLNQATLLPWDQLHKFKGIRREAEREHFAALPFA